MKKTILTTVVVGAMILTSCSNNGNKAETNEAQEVVVNAEEQTISFNKVSENSYVAWRASHLGGAQPRFGKISIKKAEFAVNNGTLKNASVQMEMNTLTVENFPEGHENIAKLTGHLQSADFFDVEKHPTSMFELTGVEKVDGEFESIVTGNLTIMDVSKSIAFKANVIMTDTEISIKSEDFAVNRSDWDLTYHAEGAEGVPVDYLIADDIGFTIDVSLTK